MDDKLFQVLDDNDFVSVGMLKFLDLGGYLGKNFRTTTKRQIR